MISIKKPCPRANKAFWALVTLAVAVGVTVALSRAWNKPLALGYLLYAIAASLFLLAQIVGFVLSQTYYAESIEEVKYRVLENEEAEWKG